MNGIQAALLEEQGKGFFEQKARKIEFRDNQDRLVWFCYGRTTADAAQMLRIFRKAPLHVEAA